MFTISISGDRQLIARLSRLPPNVMTALRRKITELALLLEAKVKDEKLSGQVLNVVTGALRRSISHDVTSTSTSVTGRVFSSGDVKYAGIHEFGGTINIPEIVPTKAQALHFFINGQEVFAKRVQAHTVKMPERSYLRSSLDEMRAEIVEGMREAVVEAVKQ